MSVADAHQFEGFLRRRSTRLRQTAYVVLAAAAIFTLLLFEPTGNLEFAIVLLGPLLTGLVMRLRGWPWKVGAAAWGLNGLTMLSYDWISNSEDRAYHIVLTLVMVALVALGAGVGRAIASARLRLARPKS
jgi:apolipoprotein N-acyltransferase